MWVGDTVDLLIDQQRIQFIEYKGKTVDWYLFMAERLESWTYKAGHVLVIPYSQIQNVKGDSILFRLTMDLFKQKGNKKWKNVYSRQKDIWISRNSLDGLLISENAQE